MNSLHRLVAPAILLVLLLAVIADRVSADKDKHTPAQLKHFDEVFMEQVKIGDLLFHGDAATEKQMGVTLSKTGMSCAMCHPWAADTHPYEFPKVLRTTRQVRHAAGHDQLVHREAQPGRDGGVRLGRHEGPGGVPLGSTRGSKTDPGRH
jgi:thiosulfate dehydrogenase